MHLSSTLCPSRLVSICALLIKQCNRIFSVFDGKHVHLLVLPAAAFESLLFLYLSDRLPFVVWSSLTKRALTLSEASRTCEMLGFVSICFICSAVLIFTVPVLDIIGGGEDNRAGRKSFWWDNSFKGGGKRVSLHFKWYFWYIIQISVMDIWAVRGKNLVMPCGCTSKNWQWTV